MGCNRRGPVQAVVDPEDKIGDIKTIQGACASYGSGRDYMEKYIPQNGEYEWAGEGSQCHYCSLSQPESIDCSFGCDGIDCCSIVGGSGTYKRVSYKADPTQCCLTGQPMIDNYTCDPIYRDSKSSACSNSMITYCSSSDNVFTKDICNTWCANNSTQCDNVKSKFCNDPANYKYPACKNWCVTKSGMGRCDDGMNLYCSEFPNDSTCACITSDLMKYKYNPLCEDRHCIDHGYQTSSMISAVGEGCKIVDCNVYLDAKAGGKVTFADVKIEQRCGNTTKNSSTAGTSNVPRTSGSSWNSKLLWIIAPIVLLVIIIAAVLFAMRR